MPYHEWFIEFDSLPAKLAEFALDVDARLRGQNIYYDDLVAGKILRPLVIRPRRRGAFREHMKAEGNLGRQNNVPRLANDRKIAAALEKLEQ